MSVLNESIVLHGIQIDNGQDCCVHIFPAVTPESPALSRFLRKVGVHIPNPRNSRFALPIAAREPAAARKLFCTDPYGTTSKPRRSLRSLLANAQSYALLCVSQT